MTKNYKGWIFGGEYAQYWTQVIYKRKERFYNPIRQNKGHILVLKYHLRVFPNVNYIPIVVFSIGARLKRTTDSEVTHSARLLKTIRKYTEVTLTEKEKEAIFAQLTAVNLKASYSRSRHVKSIKRKIKEGEQSIRQNRCPQCGGDLISRAGKFGEFKGCTNFPRCRFTTDH